MMKIRCPKTGCKAVLNVGEEAAGKKARCPRCKKIIQIPVAEVFNEKKLHTSGPRQEEAGESISCPDCGALMESSAIICIKCGFDSKTGQKVKAVVQNQQNAPSDKHRRNSKVPGGVLFRISGTALGLSMMVVGIILIAHSLPDLWRDVPRISFLLLDWLLILTGVVLFTQGVFHAFKHLDLVPDYVVKGFSSLSLKAGVFAVLLGGGAALLVISYKTFDVGLQLEEVGQKQQISAHSSLIKQRRNWRYVVRSFLYGKTGDERKGAALVVIGEDGLYKYAMRYIIRHGETSDKLRIASLAVDSERMSDTDVQQAFIGLFDEVMSAQPSSLNQKHRSLLYGTSARSDAFRKAKVDLPKETVKALYKEFERGISEEQQEEDALILCMGYLNHLSREEAGNVLIRAMTDERDSLRSMMTADFLDKHIHSEKYLVELVKTAVRGGDKAFRDRVFGSVAKKSQVAISALTELSLSDDSEMAFASVSAIGKIEPFQGHAVHKVFTHSEIPLVRRHAIQLFTAALPERRGGEDEEKVLKRRGTEWADLFPKMLGVVENPGEHVDVRIAAAGYLKKFGLADRSEVERLFDVAGDRSIPAQLRKAVSDAALECSLSDSAWFSTDLLVQTADDSELSPADFSALIEALYHAVKYDPSRDMSWDVRENVYVIDLKKTHAGYQVFGKRPFNFRKFHDGLPRSPALNPEGDVAVLLCYPRIVAFQRSGVLEKSISTTVEVDRRLEGKVWRGTKTPVEWTDKHRRTLEGSGWEVAGRGLDFSMHTERRLIPGGPYNPLARELGAYKPRHEDVTMTRKVISSGWDHIFGKSPSMDMLYWGAIRAINKKMPDGLAWYWTAFRVP